MREKALIQNPIAVYTFSASLNLHGWLMQSKVPPSLYLLIDGSIVPFHEYGSHRADVRVANSATPFFNIFNSTTFDVTYYQINTLVAIVSLQLSIIKPNKI